MASESRIAVVTGGGSGIGKAAALALSSEGYSVVVAGRRIEMLDLVATEGGRLGGPPVVPITADVRDPDSVKALFQKVRELFGRLDLLFNNAGAGVPPLPIEELSVEQWRLVVDTNLTGTFLCTREAVALMKCQRPRGGRIINNGSISAHSPRPGSAPYTATKHAITGLTKSTALDGRAFDIACGQIDIGNAATDMTEGIAKGALQADGRVVPEPRMELSDVARAVVYMATLPLSANVQFMTVMATKMPFIGRG
jgi:NAD(P)-dependent dehydrogenase (short-subunit alcohol dehydrogenase family)